MLMGIEKNKNEFDEIAQEAAQILLQQFWVLREEEAEKYQLIREREDMLRTYFLDKMGYRLIVHRYFAKLEKIPAQPEAWMGIQEFKHPRDYTLFCCFLAFLEGKSVDEQFLLSQLCEELVSLYPGEDGLDWTHYEHRKSLVRVLQFAKELGIVKVVEGNIEEFNFMENYEVLYEVSVMSRYFMRSYPKDLFQFKTKEEILGAEWGDGTEEDMGIKRRHRVYRQLFLSPSIERQGSQDADFHYLRNFRNRIREDIETHTDYQFELYNNVAMLTVSQRKAGPNLFPDNKAISDIALQFANIVRRQRDEDEIPLQFDGTIRLTWVDFEAWVGYCKEQFGDGWSKQYREASLRETARDLYELLSDWKMVSQDKETGIISLHPLLVRTIGEYPKDFIPKSEEVMDEDDEE
jgi:uncharacterized protein (TIGR02678 family)